MGRVASDTVVLRTAVGVCGPRSVTCTDSACTFGVHVAYCCNEGMASGNAVLALAVGCALCCFATARGLAPSASSGASNKFGIGLVSEGNQEQWNYASQLAGDGGWVLLTFAGIDNTTTEPQQSWSGAVAAVQQLGLNPVVRLSPPWGSSHYRDESDDALHHVYTTLAAAFKAVVSGLPRVAGQSLWVQVDNEPDLCYEVRAPLEQGRLLVLTLSVSVS